MASAAAARGMLQRGVRGRQALFGGPRSPEAQPGQPTVMAASPSTSAAGRESPACEPQLQSDSESADDEPELQASSDDEGVTEPELLRSPGSSEDGALSEHDSPTVRAASAAASAHRQARREAEEGVQQEELRHCVLQVRSGVLVGDQRVGQVLTVRCRRPSSSARRPNSHGCGRTSPRQAAQSVQTLWGTCPLRHSWPRRMARRSAGRPSASC